MNGRKQRRKWFAAPDRRCEDGWYGPHEKIENAIAECASNYGAEHPIFVAKGYKLTKAEKEEWGVEFDWQCESQTAIEVRLPPAAYMTSKKIEIEINLAREMLEDLRELCSVRRADRRLTPPHATKDRDFNDLLERIEIMKGKLKLK